MVAIDFPDMKMPDLYLDCVHREFNRRLNHIGPVVIAGGAVRDLLMGNKPRDYDIFVLGIHQGTGYQRMAINSIQEACVGIPEWESEIVSGLRNYRFLVLNLNFLGLHVQVMYSHQPTLDALLDTFDWNVSLFGYDGETITQRMDTKDIAPGRQLVVHNSMYPLSTLRRGFLFADRFKMVMERSDIEGLCYQVVAQAADRQEHPHQVESVAGGVVVDSDDQSLGTF